MRDTLLAVAGIAVTLATFWLGFRQTVGARQAKVALLNDSIATTFLKRLVVDHEEISSASIERAIRGKALESGIPVAAFRTPLDVLDVLHVRITESDLINPTDRQNALEILTAARKTLPPPAKPSRSRRIRYVFILISGSLAVAASLAGTLAVRLFGDTTTSDFPFRFVTQFGLGLVAIVVALAFQQFVRSPSVQVPYLPGVRRSTHPAMLSLATFPDETEGVLALEQLSAMSPFAIRNIFELADDEYESLYRGQFVGLRGDPNTSLGLQELLDGGFVEEVPAPPRFDAKGTWYQLTASGRRLGRLILADTIADFDTPPAYLHRFLAPVAA